MLWFSRVGVAERMDCILCVMFSCSKHWPFLAVIIYRHRGKSAWLNGQRLNFQSRGPAQGELFSEASAKLFLPRKLASAIRQVIETQLIHMIMLMSVIL